MELLEVMEDIEEIEVIAEEIMNYGC